MAIEFVEEKVRPGQPVLPGVYAETSPAICPWCRSDKVEWGSMSFEGTAIAQEAWCLTCDKEWWDEYELVGYSKRP